MSAEREMHVWRGLGLGAILTAMLLATAVALDYMRHAHGFDRDLQKLIVLAGIAELLGVVLLSVGRCLERLHTASTTGWPLGWLLLATGLGSIGWCARQAALGQNAATVAFQLIGTMLLAAGVAMLGTERLLKHFTDAGVRVAVEDTVPA